MSQVHRSYVSTQRGVIAVLAILVLMVMFVPGTAMAAQSFDQARAADIGVSENGTVRPTGFNQQGECIKSVQRWINGAGGQMVGGGAYSAYVNSPADLVTTGTDSIVARAAKGDVIQYTYNASRDAYVAGVHTVMVVANNGNGTLKIVQSNVPAGSGRVSVVDSWRPAPPANFTPYLWRFGQVTSPAPTAGSPIGSFDVATQNGTGVRFRGWAIDPDTSAPIAVHAYVTPSHGVATTADISRPDVGAQYPASGAAHGFDVTRGGIIAGTYNVCAYAINVPGTPGENTALGCKSITLT